MGVDLAVLHKFNHVAARKRLFGLVSDYQGRFEFKKGSYVAKRPEAQHIACAQELCQELGLRRDWRVSKAMLDRVDRAFEFAGIDKREHIDYLVKTLMANHVMQIVDNRDTWETYPIAQVSARALYHVMNQASARGDVPYRRVHDIIEKHFPVQGWPRENFTMVPVPVA